MAQILNTPTAAQMSAQQFTDPIMQSLQNLTSMQLNSINQQKQRANTMAGLSALMPKEQASAMSNLPPELLKMIIPQMLKQQELDKKISRLSPSYQGQPDPQMVQGQPDPQMVQGQQQNINPEDMIQQIIGAGNNRPLSNQEIMKNALGSLMPNNQQESSQYDQEMQRQEMQNQEAAQNKVNNDNLLRQDRKESNLADPDFNYDKNYLDNLVKYGDSREAHTVTGAAQKEYLAEKKLNRIEGTEGRKYYRKRYNDKWDKFDEKFAEEVDVEKKNSERRVGYNMAMNYVKSGKAQVGLEAFAKEKLGVENFTENNVSQALRKTLAREPLEFIMTIAKEGGATAVKSKAMLDQVIAATGKMRNSKDGLIGIFNMNKGFLGLQEKYNDIKEKVAERYKREGREPSAAIAREVNKKMKPHLDKVENISNEIILKTKFDNLDEMKRPEFMKKHPIGTIMYDASTDISYRIIKDGKFIDVKFIGKGDRKGL